MIDVADITVDDFKAQFYRDFDYLPVWKDDKTYNIGDLVFYDSNQLFYTCKVNGTIATLPTDTDSWTLTVANKYDFVWDEDIEKAFIEAQQYFNPLSAKSDAGIKLNYLYLTAHFLVSDLRAGGTDSAFNAPVGSRGVGNVHESYTVPPWMEKESLSFFIGTYYGYKYLILTRPYRIANVFTFPTPRHALPYNNVPSYLTGQY